MPPWPSRFARRSTKFSRRQNFILGPKVEAFEEAIAGYCGSPHAIGVSSGTDALLAVFMALGIGPGDAVITSDYSFFATAGCIARVGATPVFIDIDPVDLQSLAERAGAVILRESCRRDDDGACESQRAKHVRAIVPVHLFGLCCEMEAICKIAERVSAADDRGRGPGDRRGVSVSRSAAQRPARWARPAFQLLSVEKPRARPGDAGMVICQDEAFAERLRHCRQHGMEPRYYHHFIGGNFRLDEIQAAILGVKLPHLDEWSAARRASR